MQNHEAIIDIMNPSIQHVLVVDEGENEGNGGGGGGGEQLLERLRILLHCLQSTTEILHTWPEAREDSARVHADTCTNLIASIRKIALGLRGVERYVNGTGPASAVAAVNGTDVGTNQLTGDGVQTDNSNIIGFTNVKAKDMSSEEFRTYLETSCPIPLDLLDLLDVVPQQHSFGLHPSCYARGLMEESLRQLATLERRRRALRMLADSIEAGMMRTALEESGHTSMTNIVLESGNIVEYDGKRKCENIEPPSNKRCRDDSDTEKEKESCSTE